MSTSCDVCERGQRGLKMRAAPFFISFIIVISISFSAPFLLPRAELKTIVVSQENGADNNTCWNETALPCKTLDYALKHVTNSTLVLLKSGNYSYNLTEHFSFTNLKEISLVGEEESSFVTVECNRNGSLSFEHSENITLRRVLLRGCGGLHKSTTGDAFINHSHMPFLSAVFLVNCKDVIIDNCWVVQSPGIGLNMYDVGGDVQISHSWFESNRPIENSSPSNVAVAGGGIYVEFTFKGKGFLSDRNYAEFGEFDSNSSYTFYNCTFRGNNAPHQNFSTMIDNPHGNDHIPFGRGGGLSIFVKGVAQHNLIQINHCYFKDNHALWGGGLFIEYQDEVQNNTLEVINCTFTNNSADYAGGAIRSGTSASSDSLQLLANQIKFEDCMFISNSAVLGGGVSHHGVSALLKVFNGSLQIPFVNCNWKNNTATMGSAIGLASPSPVNGLQDLSAKGPKLVHNIVFENCNVTTNPIVLTEDKKVIGQGAIYSYSVPVMFKGVVNVEYNNNTAMVIENAAVHVVGNVTFRNNTGGQGGALGLYGTSLIMLMPHSNVKFFNNTAQQQGGAIYVRDSGPPVVAFKTTELATRPCFVAYNNSFSLENVTEWQTKVVFMGNRAQANGGGHSVYASTLQGCRQVGQPRINDQSLEWHNVFNYLDSKISSKEQISTDPVSINFHENEWNVSPSELFNATVELIDEKNSSVLGIVNISIINEDKLKDVKLGTASDLFLIQGDSPKINNLHLLGKEHSKFQIFVGTVAGRVVQNLSKTVHLKGCYPGFEQYDDTDTCTCMEGHDAGIFNCSIDAKYVFLKRGYWGGRIGTTGKFSTYPCPSHYCNFSKHNSTFRYNSTTMCTKGRNGTSVLCGACKNGYSVDLGDENCTDECVNSHLWLLLVFFIITLLLVLIVLRIELDIFTAYLNSWLYSYQIITFLLQEGQSFDPFISFVIDAANWRVKGVGTCFYVGMTNLEKLGVNYILPSYVLLLLIVLAKLARCRPTCYINRNVSRAFCTLLVLCYTNITMISCYIIHYVPIQKGKWVLYADGNIDFVKNWKTHLPYTIIACLWFIFFVIFVPLVLLFTPWFLKRFPYLQNFRLFFDTFQSCFKDEYRWFAAYYFICRLFILFIALYVPFGHLKRSILEVLSVVIVVTCLYLRPYKSNETDDQNYNWLNTLDAVLLSNLCFIVILSSGIVSEAPISVQIGLEKTVNVLAYVPLVYLLALICYYGWKYFCPPNLEAYQQVEPEQASTSESTRAAQPI